MTWNGWAKSIEMKNSYPLIIGFLVLSVGFLNAHPTGNLCVFQDQAYWSYIEPVDDQEHHACIWRMDSTGKKSLFRQSKYAASDFMLQNADTALYILERRYLSAQDIFELRLFKYNGLGPAKLLWDWFRDPLRVGEAGFKMLSDQELIFVRYPSLYRLKKQGEPQLDPSISDTLHKMRAVGPNQILFGGDFCAWLRNDEGRLLQDWPLIGDPNADATKAPMGRNSIFGMDYHKGHLLVAYWGKRQFLIYDPKGKSRILLQHKDPYTPHWVCFWDKKALLFASALYWDGRTPEPSLVLRSW